LKTFDNSYIRYVIEKIISEDRITHPPNPKIIPKVKISFSLKKNTTAKENKIIIEIIKNFIFILFSH
jgi:hypothetical protein